MIDKFGNIVEVGDKIITTVSRGSHYLTLAEVQEDLGEQGVKIMYAGTIKTKIVNLSDIPSLRYESRPQELVPGIDLFRDSANHVVEVGDQVAYKSAEDIAFGQISEIESKLWATLIDSRTGEMVRVRNVQTIKL